MDPWLICGVPGDRSDAQIVGTLGRGFIVCEVVVVCRVPRGEFVLYLGARFGGGSLRRSSAFRSCALQSRVSVGRRSDVGAWAGQITPSGSITSSPETEWSCSWPSWGSSAW